MCEALKRSLAPTLALVKAHSSKLAVTLPEMQKQCGSKVCSICENSTELRAESAML